MRELHNVGVRSLQPRSEEIMGFPSHSLRSVDGEIYCHVFENENVGLKRNLFWSITVRFAPIRYGGAEQGCSMTCEWIVLPIRSWKELDGLQLEVDYGEAGTESSFYMAEHHFGSHTRLSLSHQARNVFRVVMDMQVEFDGYLGGDEDPAMQVHADALVPFTRLLVLPDNSSRSPIPCRRRRRWHRISWT